MSDLRIILNYLIDSFLLLYSSYFLLFVLLGVFTKKKIRLQHPKNRFAIVIPAHNEEKVIDKLINDLKTLDYPKDMYDVFVVADNCTDNTAVRATNLGANVIERYNQHEKGKGYALKYAFDKLGFLAGYSQYDSVVVFDADNLVKENFLRVMNSRLMKGEQIIQSYVDAKNPSDNWVTATFSMMFWVNNRYNLQSRNNIGLSAVLMGTGMCISADTLAKVGWDTETLTEDLEYSVQALLQGVKTTFAPETRIYDEKPLSFWASCKQRLRWGRGQLAVTLKYVPQLLRQGFRQQNISMIDGGLRLFQQPFIMFYFAITILRLLLPQVFYSPMLDIVVNNLQSYSLVLSFVPYLIPSSVYVLDKISLRSFKYIILFPVFMYSWVLLMYWALITLNEKSWIPTVHTRNMSKRELAKTS